MNKYSLKYYIQKTCIHKESIYVSDLESYIKNTFFTKPKNSSSTYISSSLEGNKLIFKILETPTIECAQIHVQLQ